MNTLFRVEDINILLTTKINLLPWGQHDHKRKSVLTNQAAEYDVLSLQGKSVALIFQQIMLMGDMINMN